MSNRYNRSDELLQRALRSIPLASQTFSKSMVQLPRHVSPYFISRGKGCRVWDVDDNQYIDFINALCANLLGYQDPEVDIAVKTQIDQGVTFSLSHPLEIEVAEKLIELIPCAESVRFGKNGSDVTSAAIRLARAYTGRDHIAICGYHGWHDWYVGTTTRDLGVPKAVSSLSHHFTYGDMASIKRLFEQHSGQVAAIILEPLPVAGYDMDFLQSLRTFATEQGAILIFDEIISGFRIEKLSAQAKFNVTPDLSTFGKGLANGYPLSAVVGKKDIMALMDSIFFSSTFGGETLSLAACRASIDKILTEPVIERLVSQGEKVKQGITELIEKYHLPDVMSVVGYPSWSQLRFHEGSQYSQLLLKTYWMQETFSRGILTLGTHNMTYAHTDQDLSTLFQVYDEVFYLISERIKQDDLMAHLRCQPLEPVFSVR